MYLTILKPYYFYSQKVSALYWAYKLKCSLLILEYSSVRILLIFCMLTLEFWNTHNKHLFFDNTISIYNSLPAHTDLNVYYYRLNCFKRKIFEVQNHLMTFTFLFIKITPIFLTRLYNYLTSDRYDILCKRKKKSKLFRPL